MTDSSLKAHQQQQGAVFFDSEASNSPRHFGDPAAEYVSAREAVALFDLLDRTQIGLQGSDRQTFLNNFVTNDVKRLSPGEGCEAFLTNIKGRILGHLIVSATDDALRLDSEPGTAEFITAHLDKYLITEDVEIADRSSDLAPLLLVGPQAEAWLTNHVGDFTPPPLWGQVRGSLAGAEVIVRRVGFTQPPAFEVLPMATDVDKVWQAITAADVTPAGNEVLETLRIEAGFPRYGVDLTDENIAQESGRAAQAISFTKGCYLGQEPIARLDALGHTNKELRCLDLIGGPAPQQGTPVQTPAGETVGRITSAALSPTTDHPVALAMLKRSVLSPGTELRVGEIAATVQAAPHGEP